MYMCMCICNAYVYVYTHTYTKTNDDVSQSLFNLETSEKGPGVPSDLEIHGLAKQSFSNATTGYGRFYLLR